MCTDSLPEDNNQKMSRGSPTDLSMPLGPTKFSGGTNPIFLSLWIATGRGGLVSTCTYFSSMIFEMFIVFSPKANFSSQSCGIFQNLNVVLLQRNPGQYGTTSSLNE